MAKIPTRTILSDTCVVTIDDEPYRVHEGEWVEVVPIVEIGELEAFAALGAFQVELQSMQGESGHEAEILSLMNEHFDTICQGIASKVLAWNWTDMLGQPLPEPDGTVTPFKRLSAEELYWLFGAIRGVETGAARKNGLRPLPTTSSDTASAPTPTRSGTGRNRSKAS